MYRVWFRRLDRHWTGHGRVRGNGPRNGPAAPLEARPGSAPDDHPGNMLGTHSIGATDADCRDSHSPMQVPRRESTTLAVTEHASGQPAEVRRSQRLASHCAQLRVASNITLSTAWLLSE